MNYEEERHAEKLLSYGWLSNEGAHDLRQELKSARALLRECLVTFSHARIFITSREKMHPTGVEIWDSVTNQIDNFLDEAGPPTVFPNGTAKPIAQHD